MIIKLKTNKFINDKNISTPSLCVALPISDCKPNQYLQP